MARATERLAGEIVAVTGAGSGIGRAAALACAAHGAAVAALDLDLESAGATVEELTRAGGTGVAVDVDVTSAEAVGTAFAAIDDQLGPVSGLFNNAAVALRGDGRLTELDPAAWVATIAVNLTGAMWCLRAAVERMARAGGGAIVNNVSVAALVAEPDLDAYTASKGGLLALTRSVAAGYAAERVRCNAICPGLVRTPMTETVGSPLVRRFERETLLPIGEPADVAGLVVYLLSSESRYVTGATMVVDGGYTTR